MSTSLSMPLVAFRDEDLAALPSTACGALTVG